MKKAQELLKDRIGKETFKYLRTGQPIYVNEVDNLVFEPTISIIPVGDPEDAADVFVRVSAEDIFYILTGARDRDEILEYLAKGFDDSEEEFEYYGGELEYMTALADELPNSSKEYSPYGRLYNDMGLQEDYKDWVEENALKIFDIDSKEADEVFEEAQKEMDDWVKHFDGKVTCEVGF